MPAARCQWYRNDGQPISKGCRHRSTCPNVHPHEDSWDSLPPFKTNVRCKFFDLHGNPNGTCRGGSMNCRFIHPDDPRWAHSTVSAKAFPDNNLMRRSSAHAIPAIHGPPASNTLSAADTVRKSLPKLQTDMFKESYASLTSSSSMLDAALKHKDTPISANVPDPRLPSRRASSSALADLWVPIGMPSLDPMQSPLASSTTTGGPKQQAWRKLAVTLTQTVNLHEQLRDADRRISLYSMDNISTLASSQLDGFLDSEKAKRKDVEDKFNAIITQLMEMDFWPIPSADEPAARLDHDVRSDAYEEIIKKLDEVEAQLKKRAEFRTSFGQVHSTMAVDNVDMAEQSSRPSKRRRTSPSGSFILTSDVKNVKDRLERMETKMSEMEEGEIWDNDQGSERIEELLEKAFQQSPFSRAHAGEGPIHARDSEKGASSLSQSPQKPVETLMLDLKRNFTSLCDELAGHLPVVGKLEADIGRLRIESANSREAMISLDSSHKRLREQLDSLSLHTKDISSEIVNRRTMADSQSNVAKDCDYVIRMVGQDIKKHIAAVRDELTNLIASQYKDAQVNFLANFESTIVQTDYIYDAMTSRHFEDKQLG